MRWTPSELASGTPTDRLGVAEWIEKNRVLDRSTSGEPGPKRLSRTPYVKMILDAYEDPWVREIVVEKSAQCGITDLLVDLVAHSAACDPCPMAIFLADQLTAEKVFSDRIKPAILQVESLKYLVDAAYITQKEIKLPNGFNLPIGWASSIAMTASRPLKKVLCDEINKPGYQHVGEEGSTLGRIRERMETFADSKFIKLSTPTLEDGQVTKEMSTCEVIYDFAVPCCHCGAYQPLRFRPEKVGDFMTGGVIWEGGGEATREMVEKSARYQCGCCGGLWTTTQKNAAVVHGMAMPRGPVPERARKVGFHINRLVSLFPGGRLEDLVLAWIEAQKDQQELQNFINSALGQAWVQRVSGDQDSEQMKIMSCRTDLPRLEVPESAVALVAGVDMQQAGFWYRIRAFATDGTSWGIDEGTVATWLDLDNILFERDYPRRGGGSARIWRVLLDTGGTKHNEALVSRTEEAYEWIRMNRGRGVQIFGTKGSAVSMPTKLAIGKPIERTPSGKYLAGGLQIVSINTAAFKENIQWRMTLVESDSPGAFYIHRDTPGWYAKQMTAEELRKTREGRLEWVQVRRDNHILDCEVLCLAGADYELWGGVRMLRVQDTRTTQTAPGPQASSSDNPWMKGIRSPMR